MVMKIKFFIIVISICIVYLQAMDHNCFVSIWHEIEKEINKEDAADELPLEISDGNDTANANSPSTEIAMNNATFQAIKMGAATIKTIAELSSVHEPI